MVDMSGLQPINEYGWRSGFRNLLRRETSRQWGMRNWLIHGVIWLLLLNFTLAAVLESYSVAAGANTFIVMTGMLGAIGMVVIAQGAIINEKKSGTAAWVLSKPTSRNAFILAKLVTIAIGFLAIVIVLQGLIAYSQLSIAQGSPLPVIPFLGSMSLLALNVLFYLSLTLMLGTLFQGRIPVLGIPIAFIIIQLVLLGSLNKFASWLPYLFPGSLPDIARAMALQDPLPPPWFLTVFSVLLMSALFVYVAIQRFQREEL